MYTETDSTKQNNEGTRSTGGYKMQQEIIGAVTIKKKKQYLPNFCHSLAFLRLEFLCGTLILSCNL